MTARELAQPPFSLCLLGPFAARVNGDPLPQLRTRKDAWLLGLLALHHPRALDRAWLAGLLWPDSPGATALANLRKSLQSLRQALGCEAQRLLSPSPRTMALDLAGADVDLVAFDAAISRGDPASLAAAVALYRGPLLDGCPEAWALQERRVREEACLEALSTLVKGAIADGRTEIAERYLRQAIAVDPLRESAHRALMEILAEGGNSAAALAVYRELRQQLHQDMHAEPDPETTALVQRMRPMARLATSPSDMRPRRRPGRGLRHNLPAPPTALLGREAELTAVLELLQRDDVRLVTLTGPGDVGKTRLALELAAQLRDAFEDGVFLVSLAAIRDPALIPSTIAQALSLRETGRRTPRELLDESPRARVAALA